MVMRMVSLGFDLDPVILRNKDKKPPKLAMVPTPMEYVGYCLFPTTSIFGPFLVYDEHMKFLDSSPIVIAPTPTVLPFYRNCIIDAWHDDAILCFVYCICLFVVFHIIPEYFVALQCW